MHDDVILAKAAVIRRCMDRVAEEYRGDAGRLAGLTVQDSIVLNIQRACEASIDLALHIIRARSLPVPTDSRGTFAALATAGIITPSLSENLKRMVGFRNIAVHDYQALSLEILRHIIEERMGDLAAFAEAVLLAS